MSGGSQCSRPPRGGRGRSPVGRRWRAGLWTVVLAWVLPFGASAGAADSAGADCPPSAGPALPRGALPRATRALREQRALRIVAMGSSSTAGAGASSVGTTYPSRLALELLRRLPGHRIEVINAGINGQEAPDMLTRLQRDVFDRHPDLLIWQAGSNALLRRVPVDVVERALTDGIRRSHEHGVDVLLMDLQFAPRVNDMPERDRMLAMFGRVAMATGAPVFARFDLMRGWSQALGSRFPQMLLDDGLHLNDRSYECLARRLAQVLVDATQAARGAGDGMARSR